MQLVEEKETLFLFCETWLSDKNLIEPVLGKYHNIIRYDRKSKANGRTSGGGLLALIPKSYHYKELKQCRFEGDMEALGFELSCARKSSINFVLTYRKPSGRCKTNLQILFKQLVLEFLRTSFGSVISTVQVLIGKQIKFLNRIVKAN